MLAFVPVAFDVYRPLKPRLRWAMQCLVSFADRAGQCFPERAKARRVRRAIQERRVPSFAGSGRGRCH